MSKETKTARELYQEVSTFIAFMSDHVVDPFRKTIFKNEQQVVLTSCCSSKEKNKLFAFIFNAAIPTSVEEIGIGYNSESKRLEIKFKLPNDEVLRLLARKGKAAWRAR